MLVLISGHPRSGTTLLQQLCDGHPALKITNEFGCFLYLERPFLAHARAMLNRWQKVGDGWAYYSSHSVSKRRKRYNLRFTLYYLVLLAQGGFGQVTVERVYAAYQKVFRKTAVVGDKLPLYLYYIEQFTEMEDVKRVVVYRDCRDVTSSFLKKVRTDWKDMEWVKSRDTATKVAERWVKGIERMEKYADNLHIIRYESLVQQPEVEVARLADYLDVDVAGFDARIIESDKVGKHKHQDNLTREEIDCVMEIAGKTMAKMGYV